jgi:membrane-bound ClpP family serine protease
MGRWLMENEAKLRGLKVATVGLLLAIAGFILFLLEITIVGRILLYIGVITVFFGMFIHLWIYFSSNLRNGR